MHGVRSVGTVFPAKLRAALQRDLPLVRLQLSRCPCERYFRGAAERHGPPWAARRWIPPPHPMPRRRQPARFHGNRPEHDQHRWDSVVQRDWHSGRQGAPRGAQGWLETPGGWVPSRPRCLSLPSPRPERCPALGAQASAGLARMPPPAAPPTALQRPAPAHPRWSARGQSPDYPLAGP